MLIGEPQPDKFYGKKELFLEPTLKEYAVRLISDQPVRLVEERQSTVKKGKPRQHQPEA